MVAKPLKKEDIHCGCPNGCDKWSKERNILPDCPASFIYAKKLKSALEYFMQLEYEYWGVDKDKPGFINQVSIPEREQRLKKAFPAIYGDDK